MTWYLAATFSAIFAALTAIFAKIGLKGVDSNLATAIRTTIILFFTWGIVIFQKTLSTIPEITPRSWVFLVLSAFATGASWLFYFYALKVGEANRVVAIDKLSLVLTIIFAMIILKEKITLQAAFGALIMTIGAFLIAYAN